MLWNWFDVVVVTAWIVSTYSATLHVNPLMLRIFRLQRIFRVVRLTKTFQMFDSLHLMICSLKDSVWVAGWSLILLACFTMIAALALNLITKGYILDVDNISEAQRA